MDFNTIVWYSNVLSAIFGLIAIIISFFTLKQVQKINVNVIHDHSFHDHSIKSAYEKQDNRGSHNRNAGRDYNEGI